jgi:MFS family permease
MAAHSAVFERHALTWGIYGLVGYFAYLEAFLGPAMPFLRREQDLGYTAASLHFVAFAAGGVVAGGIADRLTARSGRRTTLWGGAAGMLLGAAGVIAGQGPVATVGAALAMGTFGSLLLVTTQSVLADRHGDRSTVALTESNIAASGCGMAASIAVGVLSATALGWRSAVVFPLLALAVLFATFGGSSLGCPRVGHRQAAQGRLPRSFWTYSAVVFLGVAVEWVIGFWGASFLTDAVALDASSAAGAMGLFFGAMLVGRFAASRAAMTVPGSKLLLTTLLVAGCGFPLLWLSQNAPVALAGLIVTGLGLGGVYPLGISVAIGAAPSASDTAAARLSIAAASAILVAPFAVGRLSDVVGIASAFALLAPLLGCAVLVAAAGMRLPAARESALR